MAGEGASVVITGRTQNRVEAALMRIQKDIRDAKVSGIAPDLATARGCAKCIEAMPAIDVLVNNLAMYEPKPFAKVTDDECDAIIETIFTRGVRRWRLDLPGM